MTKNDLPYKILQKSIAILLRRQTNILSAALVIMVTVVASQLLGLVRQRMLVSIFGASDTLGVYLASSKLPDLLFQVIIAGALSSAFIPIFSDFLSKGKEKEGHQMASTLLTFGLLLFTAVACILFVFAQFFLANTINVGAGFSPSQMSLMADLMRIVLIGQLLFIIGTFFSALLQSYNHFFIPGIAAACYNLGIILGIFLFADSMHIYAPAVGVVIGAFLFILVQLPLIRKVGFTFRPILSLRVPGVMRVIQLMGPRTLSLAVFQAGTVAIVGLISFLASPGRNSVIFDYAQTLAFAPVGLFGQTIAQAAFPVLSREKDNPTSFQATFLTSFNQMLYLILPVSAIFLVLRIPLVRLIYGAGQFDWQATVLTGRTLSFFAIAIFAQALIILVARGFYALHDTKTPLIVGTISTILMIAIGALFILYYHMGVEMIALAYSIGNIFNFVVCMTLLGRKLGGFDKRLFLVSTAKIVLATFLTGIALYVPIKLLDQLVFDTTRTVNLLMLTGISSAIGLSLYLFLTWLFNVREAMTFILLFKRLGNWREILSKSEETIESATVLKPH